VFTAILYGLAASSALSNLPESLVGAQAMRSGGRGARVVVATWLVCAALLTVAVIFGRGLGGGLSDEVLAVALSFAGGAVLASLADMLIPRPSNTAGR
jgi:zinc transporter, ZIP family